jgi:hypothetical protein
MFKITKLVKNTVKKTPIFDFYANTAIAVTIGTGIIGGSITIYDTFTENDTFETLVTKVPLTVVVSPIVGLLWPIVLLGCVAELYKRKIK